MSAPALPLTPAPAATGRAADLLSSLPALRNAVALAREEKDEADMAWALARERHTREGEPAFAAFAAAAQRRINAHIRLNEAKAALRAACFAYADSFEEEPF